MTNFDKIRNYYQHFDEDNRLHNDASGRLEYEMTWRILEKHLPAQGRILDLGGATGVYSFPLAAKGYEVYLADLSEELIRKAKAKDKDGLLKGCDVVNATDLSRYEDAFFDAVLAFGPFYHLMAEPERCAAAREISRVLKPGGQVLAAFIPFLAGSIAIVDRYVRRPEQVDVQRLEHVFATGQFSNLEDIGFQEGYYAESGEMQNLFAAFGFDKVCIRSIRGFAYEREERICSIEDAAMRDKVFELMEATADRKEIVETCGHAVYIGKKPM